ncbi:DNA polymerase IV [Propionibacterium freudenreichii]|uniref:DNA polymerase IV n=1 Tax=Propionibacterium freudenreichii TaxID=1744 RepID=UPI0005A5CF66|nr:DNA polymerase IV [Propionibacterium freudenreichii]MDK9319820.1 DNA polymerase IV [Propionibacterium freudenreichii]MDK9345115.1 DNA polymerase IV [Propionibacterium freudenreichii]MDK9668811.1 DNA polymerase IV [Propionibacterium freudenreichii]CEI22913.1 Nucleotidyltransferase/DNA polymerase involved in DNA repair (DNA polymerase IV) [Propionibacterium freudenreichii]
MRATASILHLDLDAFFASVEQRDKPSLRGKPVAVGGVGDRGVVATASYEARKLGLHSAMSTSQARHLAPHAAYLSPRGDAYRQSSRIVMALLGELSPLVEPLSIDEAFVDLEAGGQDTSPEAIAGLVRELRAEIVHRTEGLHASVGVGTSKLMAKLGSERAKPNGQLIVPPGSERDVLSPLPANAIPGVGPATMDRLSRLGIRTVGDLREASVAELVRELGQAVGESLHVLASGRDDRAVSPRGEAKSISVEDTFDSDLTDPAVIASVIERDARAVAGRLTRAGLFARTVTVKVRLADFTTLSRSRTLSGATDNPERIAATAQALITGVRIGQGFRLIGVGVGGFAQAAQEELFVLDDQQASVAPVMEERQVASALRRGSQSWSPGAEVEHDEHGRGWVWGSGLGVVTVRFETRRTGTGPVRSLRADDPALHRAGLLPMEFDHPDEEAEPEHGPGWARLRPTSPTPDTGADRGTSTPGTSDPG